MFRDRDGKITSQHGRPRFRWAQRRRHGALERIGGPHCDDGCDDESIIQAQAGVFDEGDVAIDGNGSVVFAPEAEGADDDPEDDGNAEQAEDEEEEDQDSGVLVDPADSSRVAADTTRVAADTGTGEPEQELTDDLLDIGGDGWDDLGLRVQGTDHILTYDDSNVVMGGTGDVDAQIGDADTGGVALMGTVDSEAHGGNSR